MAHDMAWLFIHRNHVIGVPNLAMLREPMPLFNQTAESRSIPMNDKADFRVLGDGMGDPGNHRSGPSIPPHSVNRNNRAARIADLEVVIPLWVFRLRARHALATAKGQKNCLTPRLRHRGQWHLSVRRFRGHRNGRMPRRHDADA